VCDYSLKVKQLKACNVATRKAKVGDELVLGHMGYGICGFMLHKDNHWHATCVPVGAEIELDRRPMLVGSRSFVECDNGERIMVTDIAPSRQVTFARGDTIMWASTLRIGLKALAIGQQKIAAPALRIKVLQLPATKRKAKVVAAPEVERHEFKRKSSKPRRVEA
jgi:hypothetical protein